MDRAQKSIPDATARDAQTYASPGKLAVIYGVPKSVETNGVIHLKYRYLRMIDAKDFTTSEFDLRPASASRLSI